MHTGVIWAHYEHGYSAHYANGRIMRALWGFGEIARNTPKKGVRGIERSHLKKRASTKKEDQKKLKKFLFFLLTLLAPRDNIVVPKGKEDKIQ